VVIPLVLLVGVFESAVTFFTRECATF